MEDASDELLSSLFCADPRLSRLDLGRPDPGIFPPQFRPLGGHVSHKIIALAVESFSRLSRGTVQVFYPNFRTSLQLTSTILWKFWHPFKLQFYPRVRLLKCTASAFPGARAPGGRGRLGRRRPWSPNCPRPACCWGVTFSVSFQPFCQSGAVWAGPAISMLKLEAAKLRVEIAIGCLNKSIDFFGPLVSMSQNSTTRPMRILAENVHSAV